MSNKVYRYGTLGIGEALQAPSTCGHCGREELKRTVKLVNPDGIVVWVGCGCAAKLLGTSVKDVRAAKKAAEDEAYYAEQKRKDDIWKARDAEWQAFLDRNAPGLDRFTQLMVLGGYKAACDLRRAQECGL